jgi:hypothetical protein
MVIARRLDRNRDAPPSIIAPDHQVTSSLVLLVGSQPWAVIQYLEHLPRTDSVGVHLVLVLIVEHELIDLD